MFEKVQQPSKKIPKKITKNRLRNIGLYYLERYESSVDNLRDVLLKRAKKYKIAVPEFNLDEAITWIEDLLADFVRLGYLNDERYAEIKINSYLNAGKPARYIQIKLRQKGISPEIIEKILEQKNFSPLEMAANFAKKKHLGPYCINKEMRLQNRQKDLAKLVRAGFDYDIALQVINSEEE